jgi:OFA family oxalate/formate antiporter-like MFS transporter
MKRSEPEPFFYGRFIVASCFIAATSYGLFYTFGVFFKALQAEFGWGRALTSSVHSMHLILYAFSTFYIGRLTDRIGPQKALSLGACFIGIGFCLCSQIQSIWQLYLYYMIASIGSGVTVSLPNATVQKWFFRQRGLALGLVTAGVGAGITILAPLSQYLIDSWGWRSAYVIIGTAYWAILTLNALAMVDHPEKKGLKPYGWPEMNPSEKSFPHSGLQDWSPGAALKTSAFWFLILIYFFTNVPVHMVMIHMVPYAIDLGISKTFAASALGLLGGISILGRVGMGILSERLGWKRGLFVCCLMAGLMLLWLIGVKQQWMLWVFTAGYGYFYGGKITTLPGLIGSFFGRRSLGEIIGAIHALSLAGGMIGPVWAGYIFDQSGSYRFAFLTGALSFFIAALLTILTRPPKSNV